MHYPKASPFRQMIDNMIAAFENTLQILHSGNDIFVPAGHNHKTNQVFNYCKNYDDEIISPYSLNRFYSLII
jgi:hypothetical protein